VPGFLRSHAPSNGGSDNDASAAAAGAVASKLPAPMGYYPLVSGKVRAFVCGVPKLATMLGVSSAEEVTQQEIGDGNLNLVFICT
jgi:hypothetical protein